MKNFIPAFLLILLVIGGCKKYQPAVQEQSVAHKKPSSSGIANPDKPKPTAHKPKPVAPYVKGENYFSLARYGGGRVNLENYAGKPVLIVFFADYCPYCRKAAPFMEKTFRDYNLKGLQVLGISVDETTEQAGHFVKELGLTFPVGINGREAARKYRTQGIPYIFLLDKNHSISNFWAGYDPFLDNEILKSVQSVL
ncbi:MAG: TlpA disulfide reductase family protein [bacterium]